MNINQSGMHGNMPTNQAGVSGAMSMGMHMAGPGVMQQPSPQQLPAQQPLPPPQDKMDNISRVKALVGSLREAVPQTLKAAGQVLHQNHNLDNNSQKVVPDNAVPRFDRHLEEFYGLCDQVELHLRTAIMCKQQAQSSMQYLPLNVIPSRLEPTNAQDAALSYPQFLDTVRLQISYAKDIHDTLVAAAQNISFTD